MPGWSGLAALNWLSINHPEVPVILVSAFADEALRTRARELGAVAVIDKPLDLAALRAAVLGMVRATDEIRRVCGELPRT